MKKSFKIFLLLFFAILFSNGLMAQSNCPGVLDLSAMVNEDHSVTLNWTNPPVSDWPSPDIYFNFYINGEHSANEDEDSATTFTLNNQSLTVGTHVIGVRCTYYSDDDVDFICASETVEISVSIPDQTTPEVNNNKYIVLHVAKKSMIKLDLAAETQNTPVKIVSGDFESVINVGDDYFYEDKLFEAGDTIMIIYGDIQKIKCHSNNENITGLDFQHNSEITSIVCSENSISSLNVGNLTKLDNLTCYDNLFTTGALDSIYCALPDRTGLSTGRITPMFNTSGPNHNIVLATNSANANAKNWLVRYYSNTPEIPTYGNYVCNSVVNSYSLTLDTPENGSISVLHNGEEIETGATVSHGDQIQVHATPDEGFDVVNITINGTIYTSSPVVYQIESDTNISATFSTAVGVQNGVYSADSRIYPNPAHETLTIECLDMKHIRMVNIQGKEMMRTHVANKNKQILNTSYLEDGIYFVIITTSNKVLTEKIVVKH